jgi:hypothetical protein
VSDEIRDKTISLANARKAKDDAIVEADLNAGIQFTKALRAAMVRWMDDAKRQFGDDAERILEIMHWGSLDFIAFLVTVLKIHPDRNYVDSFEILEAFIEKYKVDFVEKQRAILEKYKDDVG